MELYPWLPVLLVAFLLGAFSPAYLLGRVLRGVDIRDIGDGNPGAANAYRELGPFVGISVGVIDVGKGSLAVLVAQQMAASEPVVLLAGVSAVAGHNWSPFLEFHGGRGAATALGVLLMVLPRVALPLTTLAILPLFVTRNMTAVFVWIFAPLALLAWYLGEPQHLVWYGVALPVLVGLSHALSLRRVPSEGEPQLPGGNHA